MIIWLQASRRTGFAPFNTKGLIHMNQSVKWNMVASVEDP
jgi:hypothetical protein